MVKVKICGLTNKDDALKACEYGADFTGFVFFEGSPRCVSPEVVRKITGILPANVKKVGLFLNETLEKVSEYARECSLDVVQIHGNESPEYCSDLRHVFSQTDKDIQIIKTFRVKKDGIEDNLNDYKDVDFYLFDTYHPKMAGGTGLKFNWEHLKGMNPDKPYFLAGGLNPQNVSEAVRSANPFAVDVSSGVEKEVGVKDEKKLREFIKNAKQTK